MSGYARQHDWSGYTIREGAKGWIYENWSRIQGTTSGRKLLLPYTEEFPRGTDLWARWNPGVSRGDALAERVEKARVLRTGHTVF